MIRHITLNELRDTVSACHTPVAVHSGTVTPGNVFVVLPGGENHLVEAVLRGASTVVLEQKHLPLLESLGTTSCTVAVTDSARDTLGVLARAFYGTSGELPRVIGITGTNGKTTETYILEALFRDLGVSTGVIGTVSYRWPGHEESAPLTTPGCLALHGMLSQMRAAGVELAFMEVSSHALDQKRVAGIDFSGALFTNLSQDHLDYHADMEDYFSSKKRLFLPKESGGLPFNAKAIAANADDAYGRRLLTACHGSIGFGLEGRAVPGSRHLSGEILSLSPLGIRLAMQFEGQRWEISSPLVGAFNAMNLLGAQALALGLGLKPENFAALDYFTGVSGRLERVTGRKKRNVFVDYAHTPDALVKVLTALRAAGFARIITVFGCGGNRDKTKRPLMGAAVAGLTDVAVLTSDNPRDEDPQDIMDDVMPGLANCREIYSEPDRRAALALALSLSEPGDAVLVAGKGHETYQITKGVKHSFSDQEILRELMA